MGGATTCQVKVAVTGATLGWASVTTRRTLLVPITVGVPVTSPLLLTVRPAGRVAGVVSAQVELPDPPLAVSWTGVIAAPTVVSWLAGVVDSGG